MTNEEKIATVKEAGMRFVWEKDEYFDYKNWADEELVSTMKHQFESGEILPEICSLLDGSGNYLDSLCGIVGADEGYRGEIEAEMAGEFLNGKHPTGRDNVFSLIIELGNEKMKTRLHVAKSLREIADKIECDDEGGIMDSNGNEVGSWKFE